MQKVVIVGYFLKITVLAGSEVCVGQRAYLRPVTALIYLPPGKTFSLEIPGIQLVDDLPVQFLQIKVDLLLQILQQVGLQPLDTLLHRGLALELPGESLPRKTAPGPDTQNSELVHSSCTLSRRRGDCSTPDT